MGIYDKQTIRTHQLNILLVLAIGCHLTEGFAGRRDDASSRALLKMRNEDTTD